MLIRIVKLAKPEQFADSLEVQRNAWGLESSGVIPAHVMIAAQNHGGLVLGAYDGNRMVGVLFGFTALDGRGTYHYSHITGVLREYQSRGVGSKLKLAQRKHVINRGQDLVKWTYDPLRASNAYFNLRKLGAICRTYKRGMYGSLNDSLHRGRLTDRFEVEWWVKTRRVEERITGKAKHWRLADLRKQGTQLANKTRGTWKRSRLPTGLRLDLSSQKLLVEIPENIVELGQESQEAAKSWALNFRKVIENYFRKGYLATDVIVEKNPEERRILYLLESKFQL